jgi:hypothetical protein
MTQKVWSDIINALPKDLTIAQVAKLLRHSENLVRRRLEASGYKWVEVEKSKVPEWARGINWKKTNSDIAFEFGFSRERIRQVRDLLGKAKVENRGRKRISGSVPGYRKSQ